MAKCVELVPVDVSDRSGRAHFEIAANQAHADRIAGAERALSDLVWSK